MKLLALAILYLRKKHALGAFLGHLCLLPAVLLIGYAFGQVLAEMLN